MSDITNRRSPRPRRNRVIDATLTDRVEKLRDSRLARECAKLDPAEEQALADESFVGAARLLEY
jgi:hypothetical protein